MSDDPAKAIVDAMRSAFENAVMPDRGQIAYPGAYDAFEIERDFGDCQQEGLMDNVIEKNFNSLPGLSASAFYYLLQHYVEYSVVHPGSAVADYLVSHLSGFGNANTAYWRDRRRLFSTQQRRAVCEFLQWIGERQELRDMEDVVLRARLYWCEDNDQD